MLTLKSSALRSVKATNILMSASGIMHYSNINFNTSYIKPTSMSGTLHKLANKNKIMRWNQYGTVYNKQDNLRNYGYSIFNIELIKEYDKVEKIIAKLSPNHRTDIKVCFHCGIALTNENISDAYYNYDVFRLHICQNCCLMMRKKDAQIRRHGCDLKKTFLFNSEN